mmetsp:Transcript_28779/g.88068  ORF Transcript_28779/g.88068 Transcript_28779/m.88068 type:complete len:378 (+) Transcript_28779:178-1311(+)
MKGRRVVSYVRVRVLLLGLPASVGFGRGSVGDVLEALGLVGGAALAEFQEVGEVGDVFGVDVEADDGGDVVPVARFEVGRAEGLDEGDVGCEAVELGADRVDELGRFVGFQDLEAVGEVGEGGDHGGVFGGDGLAVQGAQRALDPAGVGRVELEGRVPELFVGLERCGDRGHGGKVGGFAEVELGFVLVELGDLLGGVVQVGAVVDELVDVLADQLGVRLVFEGRDLGADLREALFDLVAALGELRLQEVALRSEQRRGLFDLLLDVLGGAVALRVRVQHLPRDAAVVDEKADLLPDLPQPEAQLDDVDALRLLQVLLRHHQFVDRLRSLLEPQHRDARRVRHVARVVFHALGDGRQHGLRSQQSGVDEARAEAVDV